MKLLWVQMLQNKAMLQTIINKSGYEERKKRTGMKDDQ